MSFLHQFFFFYFFYWSQRNSKFCTAIWQDSFSLLSFPFPRKQLILFRVFIKREDYPCFSAWDVPRVMKTKFPATVMVFGMVSSDGHIMPPHIFEIGLKVNIKVNLDVLKSVVIPWCNQLASGRPCVWQQDSAPAHKSKETQAWLQKECYDFIPCFHRPSSSPDLNPLDYFVWSYVENITNMTSHNTKASLIAAIRRVFAALPPALVENACSQFQICIEVVIEAEGCYIE